jgi:hypothetical protein
VRLNRLLLRSSLTFLRLSFSQLELELMRRLKATKAAEAVVLLLSRSSKASGSLANHDRSNGGAQEGSREGRKERSRVGTNVFPRGSTGRSPEQLDGLYRQTRQLRIYIRWNARYLYPKFSSFPLLPLLLASSRRSVRKPEVETLRSCVRRRLKVCGEDGVSGRERIEKQRETDSSPVPPL